ncbi:MAG: DegT/DnrJ/EryC1/StrS aminotransferase family protein, partial [Planctomycetota bacterium]
MKIPFYLHNLGPNELESFQKVLETPFITTGAVTQEFESKLAKYMESSYAVGLTSCTQALFLLMKALG